MNLRYIIELFRIKKVEKMIKIKGQGIVEFALLLVLVAIIVVVILATLGHSVGSGFSKVVTGI